MTPTQITLVHVAAAQAGLDRAGYLMALRNVGHVDSSKKLSRIEFEDLMAFFESQGFIDKNNGAGYWQGKVNLRANPYVDEQTVFRLREFAERQKYDLGGLCWRHSHNRTREPSKLYPDEAWEIIEMCKKVIQREEGIACKAPAKAASFINGDRRARSNSASPSLFPGADAPLVGLPDAPTATARKPKRDVDRGIDTIIPEDEDDIPF